MAFITQRKWDRSISAPFTCVFTGSNMRDNNSMGRSVSMRTRAEIQRREKTPAQLKDRPKGESHH